MKVKKSGRARAFHANMSSLVRKDTIDGVEYIVCPAILINEGVYNGVFYPEEELSKHAQAWNGRPVVMGHPQSNGKPVTANAKSVKETIEVGMLLNSFWDPSLKALKSDVYIDKVKCESRAPRVLEKIDAEEGIDVSTGLFTDDEIQTNSFDGKEYQCIARNHRPDHLALLPDGRGACSWDDGAGLPRINEDTSDEAHEDGDGEDTAKFCGVCGTELADGVCPKCTAEKLKKNESVFAKVVRFLGFAKEQEDEPKLNEASFSERIDAISKKIVARLVPETVEWGVQPTPVPRPWVRDVYDAWFTYEVGNKMFRLDYEWDDDLEEVTLKGEPVEVVTKTVYQKVSDKTDKKEDVQKQNQSTAGLTGSDNNTPITGQTAKGGSSMDKLIKINSLIEAGHLPAELKETMLAAPDAVVSAFHGLAQKTAKPKTLEEAIKGLSEEEADKARKLVEDAKKKEKEAEDEKKGLIEKVKEKSANELKDAELEAMSLPALRAYAKALGTTVKANHAPAAGSPQPAPQNNEDQNGVPDMPSIDDEIKALQSK